VKLKVLKFEKWHSKLAAMQILQNFGVFNLYLISDKIKADIQDIIQTHIADEQLEIRLACSAILTGFIHSYLIEVNQDLIVCSSISFFRLL
jgi:hypothetical protein